MLYFLFVFLLGFVFAFVCIGVAVWILVDRISNPFAPQKQNLLEVARREQQEEAKRIYSSSNNEGRATSHEIRTKRAWIRILTRVN